MNEIKKKLEAELETVAWDALESHIKREALIMVDTSLDLLDVGEKVAKDETQYIQAWMNEGKIIKMTEDLAKEYQSQEGGKFLFIILQPFVFAQELKN